MTGDLDPRKHLLQYGALGAICAVLLGLLIYWSNVLGGRLLKHLDRTDESLSQQANASREMSRSMKDMAEAHRQNAEATENLNRVLQSIRITGRRKPRTTDGE
jgi:hypothetical protein